MTALPPSSDFIAASSQGAAQTAYAAQRAFLAGLLGTTGAAVDARIALELEAPRADIATAATLNLDATTTHSLRATGTTPTSAMTLADGGYRKIVAAAAWPITHSANLICPGGASITCDAGAIVEAYGEPAGVVRLKISRADGTPVVSGPGTDTTARDQIALTNIRLMLQTAISTGALAGGKQWEFSGDEWAGTSNNQTYTAGTPNYYTGLKATSYANSGGSGSRTGSITCTHTGFVNGTISQIVDSTKLTVGNGVYPNASAAVSGLSITFDFGVSASKVIQEATLYKGNATSLGGTWKWQGSNDNSSYTDIGSNFTDDANTTQVLTTLSANTTGWRYYRLQGVSGTTGGSLPWWNEFEFKINDAPLQQNMTLIPDASVSVAAAPTYMDAYFLYKDDSGSAALGTDLTVELSRNGGTNYTAATITNLASYDGTYSILRARASVASQPSATSMLCRIKTLNNKAQRVAAPALYAE